ncbi:MAG: PASTA domain-containing protein [Streptosporangiales bacterium]|nr:PASTA domain-containing protein [Streptosporangiales bacterium]
MAGGHGTTVPVAYPGPVSGNFAPIHILRNLALLVVLSLVAGILVAGIALPAVGGAGLVGKAGADSFESLPSELATPPLPERSRILDRRGNEIATYYREYRVNVPLEKVAPIMRKAIVAIEDYRFYEHGSLDFKGTLRALARNQAGGSTQGGSTLTQQYVKQVQVEQAKSPDEVQKVTNREGAEGYGRKLQELRYAVTMEKKYSKDEILERYLNIIYFGDGAYGVEAAAQHYFSTSASKLTLTQASMLAGLVRSPYAYDPTKHATTAKARRNTVLQRMGETGAISMAEAAKAQKEYLELKVTEFPNSCGQAGKYNGFFCEYVAQEILGNPAFGKTRTDRYNLLVGGGLTIRTSLDPKVQRSAIKAMRNNVSKKSPIAGSLVTVQPGTGKVRAMVVSRDFTTAGKAKKGQLNFNTAVDRAHGGGNGAQFGSNAKAFTLAAALQDGIPLGYEINAPGSIHNLGGFKDCQGRPNFYPSVFNADGEGGGGGVLDLPRGTMKSVNTFFVLLEHRVGLCKTWKMTRSLGMIRSDGTPMKQYPSLTLGSDEVDPLHVSAAYAAFAAKGKYCRPTPFEYVLDTNGKKLPGIGPECKQALSAGAANAVAYAMKNVFSSGGTAAGLGIGRQAYGKTGTTNDGAAGWFTGYTPELATSVSLASPKGAAAQRLRGADLGPRTASGFGKDAAPIWQQTMQRALKGVEPSQVPMPPPNLMRSVHVQVELPDVKGMPVAAATDLLKKKGFEPVVDPTPVDSTEAKGTVARTEPGGGQARPGSKVTLFVSKGPPGATPTARPSTWPTKKPECKPPWCRP